VTVGAAVGASLNLVWQLCRMFDSPDRPRGFLETLGRIDLLELAACGAIGAACGALPDILEPATDPNHRQLFHSLACGGVLTYGAFGRHTEKLLPNQRHALRVAAISYLSHLCLDGETPTGLPLVGLPTIQLN
jgi:hypothetical protein